MQTSPGIFRHFTPNTTLIESGYASVDGALEVYGSHSVCCVDVCVHVCVSDCPSVSLCVCMSVCLLCLFLSNT